MRFTARPVLKKASAVPAGTESCCVSEPRTSSWAKLIRPAYGTGAFRVQAPRGMSSEYQHSFDTGMFAR